MNYLAHAFLAGDNPKLQLGGLLGDFCKGPIDNWPFEQDLKFGVAHHRAIDAHSDHLPSFKQCAQLLGPRFRRTGGIVVDICFDHFLSRHWQRYSTLPMRVFADQLYQEMNSLDEAQAAALPDSFKRFRQRSQAADLFMIYGELATIEVALERVAQRFRQPQLMAGAFAEVEKNYQALEESFHPCFVELQQWSLERLQTPGYSANFWRR